METNQQNKSIVLAEHPTGKPTENTFAINDINVRKLDDGEVLLKSLYVSVDPGMRGFMDEGEDDEIGKKVALGEPITSRTVAQVTESKSDNLSMGDIVHGRLAWQKYQTMHTDGLEKVNPKVAPISTAVSILGVTGLAAYFGLLKIGEPQEGETVVVSGAAGAVGSVAVQIAELKGCRVVGIAGTDEKIDYLEQQLGIDKGINYKKTDNMNQAISEACSHGVDVFFDNVGGEIFDAVFTNINKNARIIICGQISEYNKSDPPKGPRPQHNLIKHSARMEGFVVFDYADEFDEAKKQLGDWYNNGDLTYKENLIEGFESLPEAFMGLFSGDKIGKQMVKVADANEY